MPTLVTWPERDRFLVEERMVASTELVDAETRYVHIENSSHWAPLDVPERVTELILDWLR